MASQDSLDLGGWVLSFDPNNPTAGYNIEITLNMNYARELVEGGGLSPGTTPKRSNALWRPWADTWAQTGLGTITDRYCHAQPILSGIEFGDEGQMMIAFSNRFAEQSAANLFVAISGSNTLYGINNAGDVLKACRVGNSWVMECGENDPGPVVTDGYNGAGEFYHGDKYNTNFHPEATNGAIAYYNGSNVLYSTAFDPNNVFEQGIYRLDQTSGLSIGNWSVDPTSSQRKGNGMGDLEFISETNPIEIGNRVWNDLNKDGIQNPDEPGIANVTLELLDSTNVVVGTVTTDANGNYLFSSQAATDVLGKDFGVNILPFANYKIRIAPANWTGGVCVGSLLALSPTILNIPSNGFADGSDNDASILSTVPQLALTTGYYGENNHTYDFGFNKVCSLGCYIWFDDNKNGLQDEVAANGINGVKVYLFDGNNNILDSTTTANDVTLYDAANNPVGNAITDQNGHYQINDLEPGSGYTIVFSNLPTGSVFTGQNTPVSTPENGSDANVTNGGTAPFTLVAGQHLPSIDAGIMPQAFVGSYVWVDANDNGIFDIGETPVPNASVTIYDAGGSPVGVGITDATGLWKVPVTGGASYSALLDTLSIPVGTHISNNNNVGSDEKDNDAVRATAATPLIFVPVGTYVNTLWIGINNLNPLAVQVQLNGTVASTGNQLNWYSPDEKDVVVYELQKLVGGSFVTIHTTPFNANLNGKYAWLDEKVQGVTNTYQVVVSMANGNKLVSNQVVLSKDVKSFEPFVAPNPVTASTTVQFYSSKEALATVRLLDMSGKLVRSISSQTTTGSNSIEVEMSQLPAGLYTIQLYIGSKSMMTLPIRKD